MDKTDAEAKNTISLKEIYGSEEEGKFAQNLIQTINKDLELREQPSYVFNGIAYSDAYEYNQKKAINYAPPRNAKDDREISSGMVHEKIISFAAIFLKYVFKRRVKCYDKQGRLIKGLGRIYDLAIEFSYKLEQLKKKLALIYWELFTQGNAFILEDWEVKNLKEVKAFAMLNGERKQVTADTMDFTYEFLDGLTYEDGEDIQVRRAVSRVLDGRQVIFGNPEVEELQDQPHITLEEELTAEVAEQIFGSLKRWEHAKRACSTDDITSIVGERTTLFDAKRLKDPKQTFLVHRFMDKDNNRFNIFLNGVMMLPMKTPLVLFYPRRNYPITNIPAERLKGSIYCRSVPAKTKFNADFVDWALKMLANKFEQGVSPAILARGKYTLTRDIFRAGQVTHGVSKDDFERADPENKGVTAPEFSFVQMIKDLIEKQSLNPVTAGELSPNATATEISTVENNQLIKLGYLLDGLTNGFMDMALRRAETVENKYTIKQKETLVDGKKINVYQNFTVNIASIENVVVWDELVGGEAYDAETKRGELFKKSFQEKKTGYPTEYFLANPDFVRRGEHTVDIEILPERVKDTALQMIQMWDEFRNLLALFPNTNREKLQEEYLEISGRADDIFTNQMNQVDQMGVEGAQGAQNMGTFGRPTVKNAAQNLMQPK